MIQEQSAIDYFLYLTYVASKKTNKSWIFSEKGWYYLQAQTDMLFHYLKLVI